MSRDQIFEVIVRQIAEVVPDLAQHTFSASDEFKRLGLNSIDRGEVVIMSLEMLDLQVPMVEFRGPRNIGELADLLHAKLQG